MKLNFRSGRIIQQQVLRRGVLTSFVLLGGISFQIAFCEEEESLLNLLFWGDGHRTSKQKTPFVLTSETQLELSNCQEVLLNQKNELFIKEKGKEWTLLKDLVVSKVSVYEDSIIVSTSSPGEIFIMKKGATEGHVLPCEIENVFAGKDRWAAIGKGGEVFVKGINLFGECGLGQQAGAEFFMQIDPIYFDSPVKKIAFGCRHTLYLTEKGRLYASGANDYMQLGIEWTKEKAWLADQDWFELAEMGAAKTIALLDHFNAQKCFYDTDTFELVPRVILGPYFDGKIIDCAAGDHHSVCIIQNNFKSPRVVSWGACGSGQLGHRNKCNMSQANRITSIEGNREWDEELQLPVTLTPVEIACGKNHTVIRIEGPQTSMIFVNGSNAAKQVNSTSKPCFSQPHLIKKFSKGLKPTKVVAGGDKTGVFYTKMERQESQEF